MKRAVKKKIAKIVQDECVRISKEDVAKFTQLLHKQYCTHPYLGGNRTVEQVRIRCVQQIENQLSQGDYSTLLDYFGKIDSQKLNLTIGGEKMLFMAYFSLPQQG